MVTCALAAMPLSPFAAAQVIEELHIEWPRDYAYVVGDTFEQRVSVRLQDGFALMAGRLPEAERVGLWLERDAPVLMRDGRRWDVTLRYRLINRVAVSTSHVVPQVEIEAVGEERSVAIVVPEWSYTQNPVLPSRALAVIDASDVRADRFPPPLDLAPRRAALGIAAAVALLGAGLLAWTYLLHPLLFPPRRPFAEAMKALQALPPAAQWTAHDEERALRALHTAFNETAGSALFPGELAAFLARRPAFAPLAGQVEAFFARSRELFFGERPRATVLRGDELLALCRECRRLERAP